ncbi:MAG: type IX secretion system membrane protein PorP/SprF [Bacteroidia bacterium]
MKKITYQLLLCGLFLLSFIEMNAQQDPMYSQYMFNPLSINPAYAGSRGVMNGALLYRRQWVGFNGAPNTQVLTLNSPTKKGKVGIGLEVVADQLGPKKTTAAYFTYAYRLQLGKGKLAFGLGAGMMNYRVNWNAVEYKDQNDPYASLSATNNNFPDFKAGVFYNTKKFYIGTSMTHLSEPIYAKAIDTIVKPSYLRHHGFFTVGRVFQFGSSILFSPSVIVRHVFDYQQSSIDLNLNFKFNDVLWVGVSARSEKAVVAMIQYNITEKLKVGYSLDVSSNKLRAYQSGTHEIMLGFDLNVFKSEVLSPRYF